MTLEKIYQILEENIEEENSEDENNQINHENKESSENKAYWVEDGKFRFTVKEMMKNAEEKKEK